MLALRFFTDIVTEVQFHQMHPVDSRFGPSQAQRRLAVPPPLQRRAPLRNLLPLPHYVTIGMDISISFSEHFPVRHASLGVVDKHSCHAAIL
jgi:hypothetical protein